MFRSSRLHSTFLVLYCCSQQCSPKTPPEFHVASWFFYSSFPPMFLWVYFFLQGHFVRTWTIQTPLRFCFYRGQSSLRGQTKMQCMKSVWTIVVLWKFAITPDHNRKRTRLDYLLTWVCSCCEGHFRKLDHHSHETTVLNWWEITSEFFFHGWWVHLLTLLSTVILPAILRWHTVEVICA